MQKRHELGLLSSCSEQNPKAIGRAIELNMSHAENRACASYCDHGVALQSAINTVPRVGTLALGSEPVLAD